MEIEAVKYRCEVIVRLDDEGDIGISDGEDTIWFSVADAPAVIAAIQKCAKEWKPAK